MQDTRAVPAAPAGWLVSPGHGIGAAALVDPLRTVALTAPRQAPQTLASGKQTEIKLGQGKLDVHVTVSEQGSRVNTRVTQQLPMVQVAAGNTNPGGYGTRGGI